MLNGISAVDKTKARKDLKMQDVYNFSDFHRMYLLRDWHLSKNLKQMRDRNMRKEHFKEEKCKDPKVGVSKEIQGNTVSKGDMVGNEVRDMRVRVCVCIV